MKILIIADEEQRELWEGWNSKEEEKLKDINLILSAGDLHPKYLEFLVTMLNVPLLYVRGNHDTFYDDEPPEGCMDIDDKVVDVEYTDTGAARVRRPGLLGKWDDLMRKMSPHVSIFDDLTGKKPRFIRIAGLGGSMRYGNGEDMYTESEMKTRAMKLKYYILQTQVSKQNMMCYVGGAVKQDDRRKLDILLTHAPSKGHGDMDDLPHIGFSCFNDLLKDLRPAYHLYGHVHMEYGYRERETVHESGTKQINVIPMYILEI